MDQRLSLQAKPKPILQTIHFIPNGPITSDTRKKIRSHVTTETRRKQRQQRHLSLQPKAPLPSLKSPFLEENICKCSIVSTIASSNGSPATKPLSRSALHRQQIADSYKICPRCRGVQFSALSNMGQIRVANPTPGVVTLLQGGFDPFSTLPGLPGDLSHQDLTAIHELKVHSV